MTGGDCWLWMLAALAIGSMFGAIFGMLAAGLARTGRD